MFYVKCQPIRGITIDVQIDEVFTKCPSCEKEIEVNLHDVLKEGCLHSSQVLCNECSVNKIREVMGNV